MSICTVEFAQTLTHLIYRAHTWVTPVQLTVPKPSHIITLIDNRITARSVDGIHTTYQQQHGETASHRRGQIVIFGVFSTCGNLRTAALNLSSWFNHLLFDYQAFVYIRLSESVTRDMYETGGRDLQGLFCVLWDNKDTLARSHSHAATVIQFTFVGLRCMLTLPRRFSASECPHLTHGCVCVCLCTCVGETERTSVWFRSESMTGGQ